MRNCTLKPEMIEVRVRSHGQVERTFSIDPRAFIVAGSGAKDELVRTAERFVQFWQDIDREVYDHLIRHQTVAHVKPKGKLP